MNKSMKIRAAVTTLVLAVSAATFSSTPSGASTLASIVADPPRAASISVTPAGDIVANEVVSIRVNFPSSGTGYSNYPLLTLETDGGTGTWSAVAGKEHIKSSIYGVYTFKYAVPLTEKVRVTADDTQNYATVSTAEKQLTVVPSTAVLAGPIVDNGSGTSAKATARFTPIRNGQAAQLQVQTIVTKNTREVVENPSTPGLGLWKTIATGKQNSSGVVVFTLPNPLEVSHKYRAVSGATSNEVTYKATAVKKDTGVSTIYFNTNEGAAVNSRSRYFEGEFTMTGAENPAISECAAVPTIIRSTIKGRGNWSWSWAKKSFTLKIDKAKSLCGMGESKKWTLVANAFDKSLLRSAVAFHIGSRLDNLAWTPKAKPVDLYINGSYRGSYSLVERVSIQNKDPLKPLTTDRVAIPELKSPGQVNDPSSANLNNQEPNITGGYLLEWDFRKGGDRDVTVGNRGWVGIKDPEDDRDDANQLTDQGISPQQVSYIDDYLDDADKALFGANFKDNSVGWQKYIDKASAVDYYIGMEYMKVIDGNMWASVYMYKPREDPATLALEGKLKFGPMWDFDLAAGSQNRACNAVSPTGWYLRNVCSTDAKQSTKTWFNRLNEDSEFRSAVAARWKQVFADMYATKFIDQQKAILDYHAGSADENFKKWSVTQHLSTLQIVKGSWLKEISYLRDWMWKRRAWMNSKY